MPALINQAAAHDLFGSTDPLGQLIREGGDRQRVFEVIGVVRYDRRAVFAKRPVRTIFLPLTRKDLQGGQASGMVVLVRGEMHAAEAAIGGALASIDPKLTLFDAHTMREFLAALNRVAARGTAFAAGAGLFGLLLASIGLAGVTAQALERRRKEIGVRVALGATPAGIVRLVMREGASMTCTGAALGFAAAAGVSRALAATSPQMAEIIRWSSGDPMVTVGVPLLLVSLALAACYLPARRPAAADPAVTLREE